MLWHRGVTGSLGVSLLGCLSLALALSNSAAWSEARAFQTVTPPYQLSLEHFYRFTFSLLLQHKEQSCWFARSDLCALQT